MWIQTDFNQCKRKSIEINSHKSMGLVKDFIIKSLIMTPLITYSKSDINTHKNYSSSIHAWASSSDVKTP